MKQQPTNFFDWCAKHATEKACQETLARQRWRNGFICPKCGHPRTYQLKCRHLRQCASYQHQVSPIAGTFFEYSKVPLTKLFAANYLMSADKGGISAQRLSKMIGVQWCTAHGMLRKLRQAMGDRDQAYDLSGLVELDDAYIGGHKSGKRGRGAGEKPVLFAVERRDQSMGKTHRHQANITPAHKDDQWLPSVHIVISNVKQFIGAFIMVCRTNICKSTSMNSCSVSTADIGKISCQ